MRKRIPSINLSSRTPAGHHRSYPVPPPPPPELVVPAPKCDLYASFFCSLVHVYLNADRFASAIESLRAMLSLDLLPGLRSCNSLLHRLNTRGLVSQVRLLYSRMADSGLVRPTYSNNVLLHNLCKTGDVGLAVDLVRHGLVMYGFAIVADWMKHYAFEGNRDMGIEPNKFVYSTLVHFSLKSGRYLEALTLMSQIVGRVKLGKYEADSLFSKMRELGLAPDYLIAALSEAGQIEKAMSVFDSIPSLRLCPSLLIYKAVLQSVAKYRREKLIFHVHDKCIAMGLELNKVYDYQINTFCGSG
ncbi:hypothetical protein MLD38_029473 [Melastoma candidum]|uniref:Uncharacterized protein n=1 Tax=Melastoma candidum TaxID=119954 RepID=A0ACB9N3V1_9MYRT|nr:hypothetical protein MLD38_029473 [Melastoma candidum]